MAKGGGSGRSARGGPRRGGPATGSRGAAAASKRTDAVARRAPRPGTAPAPPATQPGAEASGPFRLGAIPGATPGTWIDTWHERMPRSPLELVPLAVADQRRALDADEVDAALVRLPIERRGLSVIALYDEVPVVVVPAESHLTAADELTIADLAGEVVIVPRDDVLAVAVPGAAPAAFAPPETTAEAIATVAAGVGVVVVPMSLARLHRRRDAAYRPLADGPASTVALAWPADRTTPAVETFVGIVRGRTANSSRG